MTSDHVPIKINFNQCKINPDKESNNRNLRKAYNYNKADSGKFADILPKMSPSDLGNNVNDINKFVMESIINSADKTIPIYKQENCNKKKLPQSILKLILL